MGTYSIQPSVLEGILEAHDKVEMCKYAEITSDKWKTLDVLAHLE